jgi:hypothetical protein
MYRWLLLSIVIVALLNATTHSSSALIGRETFEVSPCNKFILNGERLISFHCVNDQKTIVTTVLVTSRNGEAFLVQGSVCTKLCQNIDHLSRLGVVETELRTNKSFLQDPFAYRLFQKENENNQSSDPFAIN